MGRNIDTWHDIHDVTTENLENTSAMTAENYREVVETRRVAEKKIREYVGQVALCGLEEEIRVWK